MSDAAIQIAETIQTGSINRAPSPRHDLNPSTVSAEKQPVALSDDIDADDIEGDEVSSGILRPIPRRANLPPLPDLRFEQSYLASISGAKTKWEVAYITIQNQVRQESFHSRPK
ncbi:MAG: hypothetical protein M1825_000945 [Sarcosagium campestre]|nr:MAG: hypothetical protein M1825_000945 [Sarcosagium campestre]